MYTSRNEVLCSGGRAGGGGRLWLRRHNLTLVIKTNGFYNTCHVGTIECLHLCGGDFGVFVCFSKRGLPACVRLSVHATSLTTTSPNTVHTYSEDPPCRMGTRQRADPHRRAGGGLSE